MEANRHRNQVTVVVDRILDRVDLSDPSTFIQEVSAAEVEKWTGSEVSIDELSQALINAKVEIEGKGGSVTKWVVAERCRVMREQDALTVHLNPLFCRAVKA